MKVRLRRAVYLFGVFSLFLTFSLFTYQNFGTYYVELQMAEDFNSDQLNSVDWQHEVGKDEENLLKMVAPKAQPSAKVLKKQLHSDDRVIWPDPQKPWEDRILSQMHFVPSTYRNTDKILKILLPGGLGDDPIGQAKFVNEDCPVNRCSLTSDLNERLVVDAVVYQNDYITHTPVRVPNQIWILWLLESPLNSFLLNTLENQLNWTATYRMDSTIVAPYAKFVHFQNFTSLRQQIPERDYFAGKTKAVAWFVSNCNSGNRRFSFALELQRYIQVDIYGACGTFECPRYKERVCFQKLSSEYLFYLSFENSNCEYYITEKFFQNALENNVVPVVMGGRKEDYQAVAPPGSFIHVEDFRSVRHLADYLQKLSNNPELYNRYFLWKGTGEFINTKFWCRVCAMLHAVMGSGIKARGGSGHGRRNSGSGVTTQRPRWYKDAEQWWRNNRTCTKGDWDEEDAFFTQHEWRNMLGPL